MKQIALWGPEKPPTMRAVATALRGLNELHSGHFTVGLNAQGAVVVLPAPLEPTYGREVLPGRSNKFDAVASARRLLAALRDLESA
jgi:hypothetical protein